MKIPDIYIKGKKDPGLIDFMDYTGIILNQGLYQMRTINSVPGWIANEGESLLYSLSGVRRCYYYIDGGWRYIQWSGTGTSLSSLIDSDGDTMIQVEESSDEDKIRFDTAGSERVVIDSNGLQMATDLPVVFDGTGGNTYWKYNSATGYLEGWVDGTKRVDL